MVPSDPEGWTHKIFPDFVLALFLTLRFAVVFTLTPIANGDGGGGGGGGGAIEETVTVAEALAEPLELEQLIEYVVVNVGVTTSEPFVPLGVKFDPEQFTASVDDHESVED